jgi:uncharacterized protein (DUF1786 family)
MFRAGDGMQSAPAKGSSMRILAIDMGTGTQDILAFDSRAPVESNVKMVMPSATEITARRIRRATLESRPILLSGVPMGAGPCGWALEAHLASGLAAYATPGAARTFDDDLAVVAGMGVVVVSEDEANAVRGVERIVMHDLDLVAIRNALAAFQVSTQFDGLALGCLDHGFAPPGYSERLFRFDHLRRVVRERNDLRSFVYLPHEVPEYLVRARSMLASSDIDLPTVFLDTGPAAVLGALQDPRVAEAEEQIVLQLGTMHTLGFRLNGTEIRAFYEHHTAMLTGEEIESLTERFIAGTLTEDDIVARQGHGVHYVNSGGSTDVLVAVTGPQRHKLRRSRLHPYFAMPHGDVMISGCYGLIWAFAERFAERRQEIEAALAG